MIATTDCSRFHNSRMISHDVSSGLVVRVHPEYSSLRLPSVKPKDSGNFTCSPENAKPASGESVSEEVAKFVTAP